MILGIVARGGYLPAPLITAFDPYWNNVTSLLRFDGTDGSSTITDEKGIVWTRTAEAFISTEQSVFGGSSLKLISATTQRIYATSDAFGLGLGDFTIELWVRPDNSSVSSYATILQLNNGSINFALYYHSYNSIQLNVNGTYIIANGISQNNQYFVRISRTSGVFVLQVNDNIIGTHATSIDFGTSFPVSIGATIAGANSFKGYIDELRVTKGVARTGPAPITQYPLTGDGAYTTWDISKSGSPMYLSAGCNTAKVAGAWRSILGTKGKSGSGKWQFEVVCAVTSGNPLAGISDAANIPSKLSNYLGASTTNAIGHSSAAIYKSLTSAGVESGTFTAWSATGHVLLDLDANTVSFYSNGVPSKTITIPSGVEWFPATSVENNASMTLRTSSLFYPVAGYSDWDTIAVPSTDEYWNSVISLLNFNDTNGSTTFTDSKSGTWTINAGSPVIVNPGIFDGSLSIPSGTQSTITRSISGTPITANEDFTAECFATYHEFPAAGYNTSVFHFVGTGQLTVGLYSSTTWNVWVNGAGLNENGTTPTPTLNRRYHIALVRKAGIIDLYIDGNRVNTSAITSNNSTITTLYVGHAAITWAQYKGVTIDSFRFSRIARYAGPFNPYIADNPTS
jgi:hypothetical protein